jgi:hypothetical protein
MCIAEQLATLLQVGADTRHLAGETEPTSQFFCLEDRLAGFALDAGHLLLGQAHGRLGLGQLLGAFATGQRARVAQFLQVLRQCEAPDGPSGPLGLGEHLQASQARLPQRLSACALLLQPARHALIESRQPLTLALILGLERARGRRCGIQHGPALCHQLGTSSLDGARLLAFDRQPGMPREGRVQCSLGGLLGVLG